MDPWRFYDITHRHLPIMNPLSSAALDRLVERVALAPGSRVLDVGCGKGEFLLRLARRYGIRGVGVDLSPFCIEEARKRATAAPGGETVSFVHADGRSFQAAPGAPFEAASCLGATWIYGGFRGTVGALATMVRPGGLVAVGHLFCRADPPAAYLELEEISASEYQTHAENVKEARRAGLSVVESFESSIADFDHYEESQWNAAAAFAAAHPTDPDQAEVARRTSKSKEAYRAGGREALGWAVYLLRRPP